MTHFKRQESTKSAESLFPKSDDARAVCVVLVGAHLSKSSLRLPNVLLMQERRLEA